MAEGLYDQMREDDLRVACDLPTGLGKTFVIAVWLIAFASPRGRDPINLRELR